jgi:hypothetical protein
VLQSQSKFSAGTLASHDEMAAAITVVTAKERRRRSLISSAEIARRRVTSTAGTLVTFGLDRP